uniref:RNA dependent RNA polymerase n=1 Tax=Plasmopara viticola lesion associated Partitivirus 8 TaxID=2692006 RepID=A0A6B9Q4S9_9VIRU|nr:RNA dependent RNA polymerase [Plasmopara viticola lesion associated Partitivirus 8]
MDPFFSQDVDSLSDSSSFGVQPGTESLFDPSKRTAKRHKEAGSFYNGYALKEIARYGGYSTYSPPGFTDSWVRTCLKRFDFSLYRSLHGFTRRGSGLEGMYKSLYKFDGPTHRYSDLNHQQQRAMNRAVARARKAFELPHKNQPLDWHEIGQHMRVDTSAGISFPGKKKGEVMREIYDAARWLGHRVKHSGKLGFNPKRVQFPPAMAGQRGGMSQRDDPKTRLVWVYPAEMLVLEGHYAPMLYRQYMERPDTPLLTGKSAQRLYAEWLCKYRDGEVLHGLDFSSFDTTVPSYLIHAAFDIMHGNIDWEHWDGKKVGQRDRQKWKNVWDACKWYFINTPIMMPDGRMFRKSHGVPSGSWFTQIVDSIVNYILVEYLAECQDLHIQSLRVLGDDSGFRAPHPLDLVQAQRDADGVGMTLKPEKCDTTTDPVEFKLLGTTYRDGHAFRPDEEWFKLALYPENIPPDVSTSITRLVGLWIGGAMWSATFCKFFEFYQTCYPCPQSGMFSKDTRRWLEIIHGSKSPRGWSSSHSLFWRSIFYTL